MGAQKGIWKQPPFGANEEEGDDNNTNINKQQDNKGEKAKGGWVLCNFFGFCFVVGFSFLLCLCQAQKVFYHQESGYYLQIKHNRWFLPQSKRFCHGLGFS